MTDLVELPQHSGGQPSRPLRCSYLGLVPYGEALALQTEVRRQILEEAASDALLLLEHPPVVTLGRNARGAGLVADPAWFESQGVEVFDTDRGGQATLHAPGQLVGYPVINLNPDRRDIRKYVRDLEQVLIDALARFDVEADHSDDSRPIGVWVHDRKIASIGVHLKKWVTTHGFALNLTTDMSLFQAIAPCGLTSDVMTSVERATSRRVEVSDFAEVVAQLFSERFGRSLVPLQKDI